MKLRIVEGGHGHKTSRDKQNRNWKVVSESGRLWKDDAIRKSLWTMKSRSLK